MKSHVILLFLSLLFFACNGKKVNQGAAASEGQPTDKHPEESTTNPASTNDNAILGEWFQQYAVLDQNGNAVLDPAERSGTQSTMGFNYFHFKEDGNCLYDSDVKFKGKY